MKVCRDKGGDKEMRNGLPGFKGGSVKASFIKYQHLDGMYRRTPARHKVVKHVKFLNFTSLIRVL